METQKQFERTYSFEFFPPKTDEGKEKLKLVREKLGALNPKYFSVTFGAGGSTQQGTLEAATDGRVQFFWVDMENPGLAD